MERPTYLRLVDSRPDPPIMPPLANRWLGSRVKFRPADMLEHDAKFDTVIRLSRRWMDDAMMENCIAAKMADQADFVRWWRETVPAVISQADAESLTGVTQQDVDRWAELLKDRVAYGDAIFENIVQRGIGKK